MRTSPDTVRAGAFDLAGTLATLGRKAEGIGARRIVFDSLDVMLRLIDDPERQRQEVYRIHDWLSGRDLTGLITARLDPAADESSVAHGFLPFIADCVVRLSRRVEDRIALRSLQVVKYRGSGFTENEAPLVIGPAGIEVARPGSTAFECRISEERVSTGIVALDDMLRGGYFRATSMVVTGASGTAKTTLAGAFAEATCLRHERALYICFDEGTQEVIRNLRSVDIQLEPHVASGLLRITAARAESRSADAHLLRIRALIDEHQPRCLIIDPLSAITRAGGAVPALSVARRLIYHTKREGITLLCTSLLAGTEPDVEATPLAISTLADTWIHLSYQA